MDVLRQCTAPHARDAVASGFVPTAMGRVHHAVSGDGPAMILVHELGGSLRTWDAVCAILSSRFRLLSFDLPGHGLSDPSPGSFTMKDLARHTLEVADTVGMGRPCWLLAVAAGCAVALEIAAMRPAVVSGMVLCSPSVSVDAARRSQLEKRADLAQRQGMAAVVDAALQLSYPEESRNEMRYQEYRTWWMATDPVSYQHACHALLDVELEAEMACMRVPCLLIGGSQDRQRPVAYVKELASRIPSASYAELDCGHIMPYLAPADVANAVLHFVRADVASQAAHCASAGHPA